MGHGMHDAATPGIIRDAAASATRTDAAQRAAVPST